MLLCIRGYSPGFATTGSKASLGKPLLLPPDAGDQHARFTALREAANVQRSQHVCLDRLDRIAPEVSSTLQPVIFGEDSYILQGPPEVTLRESPNAEKAPVLWRIGFEPF